MWDKYLKKKIKKNEIPESKEEYKKKWFKKQKRLLKILVGTAGGTIGGFFGGVGSIILYLGKLLLGEVMPSAAAYLAGLGITSGAGLVAVLAAPPVISAAAFGLILTYVYNKQNKKKFNPKKTKELLRKEIKERKDELEKLKQLKNK